MINDAFSVYGLSGLHQVPFSQELQSHTKGAILKNRLVVDHRFRFRLRDVWSAGILSHRNVKLIQISAP
ncbi:unnamed protein product, partial [Nesidiocoris tenuis]